MGRGGLSLGDLDPSSHRRRKSLGKGGKPRPTHTHLAILRTPEWAGRRRSTCPGVFRWRETMLGAAPGAGTALLGVMSWMTAWWGEGSSADPFPPPFFFVPQPLGPAGDPVCPGEEGTVLLSTRLHFPFPFGAKAGRAASVPQLQAHLPPCSMLPALPRAPAASAGCWREASSTGLRAGTPAKGSHTLTSRVPPRLLLLWPCTITQCGTPRDTSHSNAYFQLHT